MPRLVSTGNRTGKSKTYETKIACPNCGQQLSSLEENCPNCGGIRKADYNPDEILDKGKELTGENLHRVKSGAKPCMYCQTLTFNYNAKKRGYVCTQCGAGDGTKSDYELGGGKEEYPNSLPRPATPTIHFVNGYQNIPELPDLRPSMAKKVGFGVLIGLGAIGLLWLLISLFTTHEVQGTIVAVSWQITAHQEEYLLKDGEGWNLPAGATEISSERKYRRDQENIVGYTYGTYYVDSTPEVIDITYSDVPVVIPGAYYTSEPYDCGSPTMEAGGSVSYNLCSELYQEDDTYSTEKSDPTYVYAPVVQVEKTTEPTPVYGTPTPIFETYYTYTFWDWYNTGTLGTTSGIDNLPVAPQGQTDDTHRVALDSESYHVTIVYDNDYQKVFDSSNSSLLQTYQLGSQVTGKFNMFGGFSGNK